MRTYLQSLLLEVERQRKKSLLVVITLLLLKHSYLPVAGLFRYSIKKFNIKDPNFYQAIVFKCYLKFIISRIALRKISIYYESRDAYVTICQVTWVLTLRYFRIHMVSEAWLNMTYSDVSITWLVVNNDFSMSACWNVPRFLKVGIKDYQIHICQTFWCSTVE